MNSATALDNLYDLATGDEDARVCKDIPESACRHLPRNFFAQLLALVATKTGDRLAGPKLVLAWLLTSLGAPAFMVSLLVPIRESLALLPQLVVAAAMRRVPRRKWFWVGGSLLQGLAVGGMALVAVTLEGAAAGWAVLALLVLFSLARGASSVAAKDVMGKTVSKTRRGKLTGYATSAAGVITISVGLWLALARQEGDGDQAFFAMLLAGAAIAWWLAAIVYSFIVEEPGATEGGGNAATEAWKSISLLWTDRSLRHFVLTRALLLSTALAFPFYVVLANRHAGGTLSSLALMIIANGSAAWLSAPLWGRYADRSSRRVLIAAAAAAALLGALVSAYAFSGSPWAAGWIYPAAFFLLAIIHTGVRVGRKTYLVDMADSDNRATYVAISNTAIGVLLLAGSSIGVVAELAGVAAAIAVLAILAAAAAVSAVGLKEVQQD